MCQLRCVADLCCLRVLAAGYNSLLMCADRCCGLLCITASGCHLPRLRARPYGSLLFAAMRRGALLRSASYQTVLLCTAMHCYYPHADDDEPNANCCAALSVSVGC